MAFKQYKGDRMPSALPQKSKSGTLDEDLNLTYKDIQKSRLNELNKMDEFDLAPGQTPQDWMKEKMDFSIDSLNTQRDIHLADLREKYKNKEISATEAKERKKKVNYDFKKQDKYLK